MVKVNIKKFSRAKTNDELTPLVKEPETKLEPKIPKGRTKKIKEPEQVDNNNNNNNLVLDFKEPSEEVEEIQNEDKDFLNDLNNENYIFDTKENNENLNESEIMMKSLLKPNKKSFKKLKLEKEIDTDTDSLFGDSATPLLGKDRRVLIAKIHQYKNLFPNELKKFKIKQNSSLEHLKEALSEMEAIVETSSIDAFMTDSILQCIKLVETGSSRTKYNIQGTADLLKSNEQFHNLTKQLYVKYNVFSKVPPEFQLVLLVGTTAMLCKAKNDKKREIEGFLNEKIEIKE